MDASFLWQATQMEVSSVWITADKLSVWCFARQWQQMNIMYREVGVCVTSFEKQKAVEEEQYTVLKSVGRTRLMASLEQTP